MFIMRAIFVRVWVKASVCPVGGGAELSVNILFLQQIIIFFLQREDRNSMWPGKWRGICILYVDSRLGNEQLGHNNCAG